MRPQDRLWGLARRAVFWAGRQTGWAPQRLAEALLRLAYAHSSPRP